MSTGVTPTVAAYLVAVAYLGVVVAVMLVRSARVPVWLHPLAVAAGTAARLAAGDSVGQVTASVAAAAVLLGFVVAVGARYVAGGTVFTVVTVAAVLPLDQWWALGVGLAAVAVAAVVQVARAASLMRVQVMAADTMSAFGVNPSRAVPFQRPDLSLLPVDGRNDPVAAKSGRLPVPPFLLIGAAVGLLAAVLNAAGG